MYKIKTFYVSAIQVGNWRLLKLESIEIMYQDRCLYLVSVSTVTELHLTHLTP